MNLIELPNVAKLYDDMLMRKAGTGGYRAKSLHASSIGHPCERFLVYEQVLENSKVHPVRVQRIFALGRLYGEQAVVDVIEALRGTDYELSKVERPVPHNEYGIGGREDLAIAWRDSEGRQEMPVEVKSMSPFIFDSIKSVEDMKHHKYSHIRKYPAQLAVYLHFSDAPQGAFLLRNKSTGEYRWIIMHRDYIYAGELLDKATRINKAVKAYRAAADEDTRQDVLPQRIQYDPNNCDGCNFRTECIPDMSMAEGVTILWESELEAWCNIREMTEEKHKEWKEADEKIKAHCQGVLHDAMEGGEMKVTLTENYEVIAKSCATTRYNVPDEIKQQYAVTSIGVRKSIKRIDQEVQS